jgi:hypothetical protein
MKEELKLNVRKARKEIQHRGADVLACLKWHRFKRLHLASNLLTELATIIQYGSRNGTERVLMISLKSAVLSKDSQALKEILGALK